MAQLVSPSLPPCGTFGALLRACRHRAFLSQAQLAARAELSERTVRDLEAGRVRLPRTDTARLLAEALKLSGPEREGWFASARGSLSRERAEPAVASPSGPAQPPRDVPAQLPLNACGFVGRRYELGRLDAILAEVADQPTAGAVIAMSGTAGVGKTTLAVHWAHHVRDRFPDGQLYVNLRGFDPCGSVVASTKAVRGFLNAFGVPRARIPASLDAQAALYRSLLAGRRVLVLLDNAQDADQVRPLLPGSPGCLVVLTSRNKLTSLVAAEGAHPLAVDLLTTAEARELLTRRLGRERVLAEPRAVEEIIARCARLPLALAVVAARAATHRGFTLAVLAAELRDASGRLDALGSDDASTDVRTAFAGSYPREEPMMGEVSFVVSDVDNGLRERLNDEINAFNVAATGHADGGLLCIAVRENGGDLRAGLYGWTWGGCGYIDLLWVRNDHRGSGLGTRLLAAAEQEIRRRGCDQVVLSTHSFQAPGFYARFGYQECGRTPAYPRGHDQIHLVKRFS